LVRQAIGHRNLAHDEIDQRLGEPRRDPLVASVRKDDYLANPRLQAEGDADGGLFVARPGLKISLVAGRAAGDDPAAFVRHVDASLEQLGGTGGDGAGDAVEVRRR
jgi:hypothetical protein